MLTPKKFNFIKVFKKKKATQNKFVNLNQGFLYTLISIDYGLIEYYHIELIRRFLTRSLKKKGNLICRLSLTRPLTKKSSQSRMGKGCGKLNKWFNYIQPGKILFELQIKNNSVYTELSDNILNLNKKLSFKTKLIKKNVFLKNTFNLNCLYIKVKQDFLIKSTNEKFFSKVN